jgi:hypothetical protein
VGTSFLKKFNSSVFRGTVTADVTDAEGELYHVVYEDGDEEDLERCEVEAGVRLRIGKLTVPELKRALEARGLPCAGLKAALAARLVAAETETGAESGRGGEGKGGAGVGAAAAAAGR